GLAPARCPRRPEESNPSETVHPSRGVETTTDTCCRADLAVNACAHRQANTRSRVWPRTPKPNPRFSIRSAIAVDLAHGPAAAPEGDWPRAQERLGCGHDTAGGGDARVGDGCARRGPLGRRQSAAGIPLCL